MARHRYGKKKSKKKAGHHKSHKRSLAGKKAWRTKVVATGRRSRGRRASAASLITRIAASAGIVAWHITRRTRAVSSVASPGRSCAEAAPDAERFGTCEDELPRGPSCEVRCTQLGKFAAATAWESRSTKLNHREAI